MFEQIVHVTLPVTICALYTCFMVRILAWDLMPTQPTIMEITWRRLGISAEEAAAVGGGGRMTMDWTGSVIIVLLILCLLIIVTLLMLLILYLGWHRCLVYYFYLPSLIIFTIVTPAFFRSIMRVFNYYSTDAYTAILAIWNFTALGMMAIFGVYAPTPLWVQQIYLIHNAAVLSVLIIYALPGWAPWLLLAFIMIWDLFAVLAPYGPLNMIISLADHAGVTDMPGLVYSTELSEFPRSPPTHAQGTGIHYADRVTESRSSSPTGNDDKATAEDTPQPGAGYSPPIIATNSRKIAASELRTIDSDSITSPGQDRHERIENITSNISSETGGALGGHRSMSKDGLDAGERSLTERGLSIGLGDFIFYSLLIGLNSVGRDRNDFYTVLATLVAVLFGLVLTLITLALTRRALPALPISVGLGLAVAMLTSELVTPLANELSANAIFI